MNIMNQSNAARLLHVFKLVVCAASILFVFAVLLCIFTTAASRCDFNYRMAEIDCVKKGVDPFLIWSEKVVFPPYYSNNPECKTIPAGCDEQISVYTPWQYLLMSPFSFFDRNTGWWMYAVFSAVCCFVILSVSKYRFQDVSKDHGVVFALGACPLLCVMYPVWSNFMVGNNIVVILCAAILMTVSLLKRQNILAGLCWMIVMIKPQCGLLFAIPLLFRMKVVTGIVAVFSCIFLSIPAVILCKANLMDMFFEPAQASAFAFEGCGTWPKFLCGYFSNETDIAIGLAIGTALCLWMTWLLRREKDWLVYLMPAAVCSSCWTYTQAYTHAMGWFLAYAIIKELIRNPYSKVMRILAAFSLLVLPRFILAWHGLYAYMGWRFPMSEFMYRSVDSLNSTCSLALALAFCLVKCRNNRED
jgi:hypothetical protein